MVGFEVDLIERLLVKVLPDAWDTNSQCFVKILKDGLVLNTFVARNGKFLLSKNEDVMKIDAFVNVSFQIIELLF